MYQFERELVVGCIMAVSACHLYVWVLFTWHCAKGQVWHSGYELRCMRHTNDTMSDGFCTRITLSLCGL